MTTFHPGVPQPTEYNAFFEGYVSKSRAFPDPIQKLDEQLNEVLSLLRPLDTSKQLHRYAPRKWSIKEMIGHLIDTERIMTYRALRLERVTGRVHACPPSLYSDVSSSSRGRLAPHRNVKRFTDHRSSPGMHPDWARGPSS